MENEFVQWIRQWRWNRRGRHPEWPEGYSRPHSLAFGKPCDRSISPVPPALLLITAVRTASADPTRRKRHLRVDQSGTSHIVVGHLITSGRWGARTQLSVHLLIELAIAAVSAIEGFEAGVTVRHFLLDDVGPDGRAQMAGLSSQVGRCVVILAVDLKGDTGVAPQDGGHAQFACAYSKASATSMT